VLSDSQWPPRRPDEYGTVLSYRTFHNADPPRILQLWVDSGLGRGAIQGRSTEPFEISNYAQPYFDPKGLILACDGDRVVGMAHGGFGTKPDQTAVDPATGILCVVMVHPEYRRQGIGRELVRRVEAYLRERGSTTLFAGPSFMNDPFYFGIYGGSRPSGFFESDPLAGHFLSALGYDPIERHGIFIRDMSSGKDPTSAKVVMNRRQTFLEVSEKPQRPTWWWFTRFGRLDCLQYQLKFKKSQETVAVLTAVGLDQYIPVWNQRAIGLVDLVVTPEYRGQGFGMTTLIEVIRQLRQDLAGCAEIHSPETNESAMRAVVGAGFERVDTGIVYRRREIV
jgi:ribosomal protein S18 acetylase RimI-like enzyme